MHSGDSLHCYRSQNVNTVKMSRLSVHPPEGTPQHFFSHFDVVIINSISLNCILTMSAIYQVDVGIFHCDQ